MKNVIIVAHRGASYTAPENTIPSFQLAFKENADFIEGDFWLTKDDEIVCIHDPDTRRTTKEKFKLKVQSSELAALRKLDVGSWKGNEYRGTTIPTLQEILSILPNNKGIYIEIKDGRERFLKILSEVLSKYSAANNNIRIISFNPNTVKLSKKYLPEVKVYWLFGWYFSITKFFNSLAQKRIMQTLPSLNCNGIHVNSARYIDASLVKFVNEINLEFCAFNVEKKEDAIRLINLNIDSITTNSPGLLRKELDKYYSTAQSE